MLCKKDEMYKKDYNKNYLKKYRLLHKNETEEYNRIYYSKNRHELIEKSIKNQKVLFFIQKEVEED